jgi:hypothetical protein
MSIVELRNIFLLLLRYFYGLIKIVEKINLITLLSLAFTTSAWADSCDTEKGVNLSTPPGPYQSLTPTNQGRLGTCFSHSATNLLRSYMGVTDYVNIIDAATISDSGVDGGQPDDVIEGFLERRGSCYKNGKLYADANGKAISSPWMCKDNGGQFSNLFPSPDNNILSELESILMGVPVHYTMSPESPAGIERTRQISEMAIKMSKGAVKPCKVVNPRNQFYDQYLALIKQIDQVDDKIKKLKEEKSAYGTEWFWTTFGYRTNADIDKDLKAQKNKKADLEKKQDNAYKIYSKNDDKLKAGKVDFAYLDKLSVDEAAEIVHFWAKDAYQEFKAVFKKYGIEKYAGTIDQFIKERVERDPKKGFQYGGRMYAYKMVKKAIENSCTVSNRICIDKSMKVSTMTTKSGTTGVKGKMESLLTQGNPQGVGITIKASILDGVSSNYHAVNIIGCRTVTENGYKMKQYLVHNSWGTSCMNYMSRLQSSNRCQSGRVWIDENSLLNNTSEIQWISK